MGKSSGGGAGAMLDYGNKALDLQKQIYNENKGYIQPYFQAGTTGLNELMMRLGLGDGTASGQKTPDQYRQELIGQYTSQPVNPGSYTASGNLMSMLGGDSMQRASAQDYLKDLDSYNRGDRNARILDQIETGRQLGYFTGGQTAPTVDYTGLNSAVQSAMSGQQAGMDAARQNPLYGSLLSTYTGQDIYADPSYKFRFDQGQKATERALSAQGKYLAPAGVKALQEYGQGMASEEYGNAYNRFVNDQTNIYNRLANIAGMGQTATGQLTGIGNNYAAAGNDLYTGMGNAITASKQAKAQNKSSMFNTLLGTGLQLALAPATGGSSLFGSMFTGSDPALKKDIKLVGEENGYNIYEFSYKNDDSGKRYVGVMADEVIETNPDAVKEIDGYLAVNYDMIGVKFREVQNAA